MAPGIPGSLAGRLVMEGVLGTGSFGSVLAVAERTDGTRRALKLVPVQGDGAREARELAAATRVVDPHLIRTFATGIEAGTAWLLMERGEGSLADLIDRPDGADRVWELLGQVATGLVVLHGAGMVHRDLKPANVLLVGGRAKLADFGLARGTDLETLTRTGMVMGTLAYMAPEQARGDPPSPAFDAWALGVMYYQLLEGKLPLPAGPVAEQLAALARGPTLVWERAPARLAPGVLARLASLVGPDPGARVAALAQIASGLPPLPAARGPAAVTRVVGPPVATPDAVTEKVPGSPARPGIGPAVPGRAPEAAPGAATPRDPGRAGPGPRLATWLALALSVPVLAWGLFPGDRGPSNRETPTGPPPTDSPTGGDPEREATPWERDPPAWTARVEAELGELAEAHRQAAPWRRFLNGSRTLAALRRFAERAPPATPRTPPDLAGRLAALDRVAAARGLPRPFLPYLLEVPPTLESRPAVWTGYPAEILEEIGLVAPPPGPWLAAALQQLEVARRVHEEAVDRAAAEPTPSELASFQKNSEDRALPAFLAKLGDPSRAAAELARMQPGIAALELALAALARSIVREPATAPLVPILARRIFARVRYLFYSHLGTTEPELLLGPSADDPVLGHLGLALAWHQWHVSDRLGLGVDWIAPRYWALGRQATRPGAGVAPWEGVRLTFAAALMARDYNKEDYRDPAEFRDMFRRCDPTIEATPVRLTGLYLAWLVTEALRPGNLLGLDQDGLRGLAERLAAGIPGIETDGDRATAERVLARARAALARGGLPSAADPQRVR